MRKIRGWFWRLGGLFKKRRRERELADELESHLQMHIEDNLRAGMTQEQARREALIKLGGMDQTKEIYRDRRGLPMLETLLQDIHFGARMLRKNPGFTAVAIITLALGIGANTTIFSFINALLLRPPSGVEEPNRLVSIWNRLPNGHSMQLSYPEYRYFRDQNNVFSGLLAYSSDPDRVLWTRPGQSQLVIARMVSANYFSLLGVKPALGRGFLVGEDKMADSQAVAILSHSFWQQNFGADPGVLGKTMNLNGHTFTVVGVAPANFRDLEIAMPADFWAPITMQNELMPGSDALTARDTYWVFVAGRLKPGISRAQAQADMSVLAHQLSLAHPESNKGWDATATPLIGIDPLGHEYVVIFGTLLMVMVGLVLLIACANAANLLLAQASGRWREMAIRAALGAQRSRILRQVLTESILLSSLAGGIGILFAKWTAPLVLALKPPMLSFIQIDLPLDWRMFAFTALTSIVTGIFFGLAPALNSSRIDVVSRLKDETHNSHRLSRFRSALVVVQVSVCLVLIITATLCLRSLMRAQSIDPGFTLGNRLVVDMDLSLLGYTSERRKDFYLKTCERVSALPGVRSATVTSFLPLGFSQIGVGVIIPGKQAPAGQKSSPGVGLSYVGPHYFQTMGIPLLAGREFRQQDNDGAPGVVIINEVLAHRYWPGQNPLGRQVLFKVSNSPGFQIIGVVKTGKYRSLGESPQPFLYRPFLQMPDARQATLVIETAAPPGSMVSAVRNAIETVDPVAPITTAETMEQYMSLALFLPRFTGVLVGVFGGLALALAMVGLYGVIAYSVAQRTREIGVRVALGATRAAIVRLVVSQGMRLACVGVIAGAGIAFGVTRLLSTLLYGISATDPLSFLAASALFLLVALAACYMPARRATKVDPMVALRYE